jgi:hypothetical protein
MVQRARSLVGSWRPTAPPVVAFLREAHVQEIRRSRVPRQVALPGVDHQEEHQEAMMDVLSPRCAGLDVHKKTVVACLLTPGSRGRATKTVRTFGTMTADLVDLAEWLSAASCTHVATRVDGVFLEAHP